MRAAILLCYLGMECQRQSTRYGDVNAIRVGAGDAGSGAATDELITAPVRRISAVTDHVLVERVSTEGVGGQASRRICALRLLIS